MSSTRRTRTHSLPTLAVHAGEPAHDADAPVATPLQQSAGFVHDRLGRKKSFTLFAAMAGVSLVAYFLVPTGSNTTLLIIGFPLGFFASGCFSGFGSYLAELYPTRARGTGSGFCYNVGRALGALFPGIIGFLAAAIGLGGAVAFGVFGYVLAIAALQFLPETHGKELVPVE